MGFIINLVKGIVELALYVTTSFYGDGMAQQCYDNLCEQEEELKNMSTSEEQRQRLVEVQMKKARLDKGIKSYDTYMSASDTYVGDFDE